MPNCAEENPLSSLLYTKFLKHVDPQSKLKKVTRSVGQVSCKLNANGRVDFSSPELFYLSIMHTYENPFIIMETWKLMFLLKCTDIFLKKNCPEIFNLCLAYIHASQLAETYMVQW